MFNYVQYRQSVHFLIVALTLLSTCCGAESQPDELKIPLSVDGLEVIIPIAANTSIYHYYRSNGLIRHPFGFLGEDIDYLYDYVHSNPQHCDYCDDHIRDREMARGFDRITRDYNFF
jgi:hypothetical protein